jgi:class 3 adenylate cyclase
VSLAEKFIEVNDWATSRKIVVLSIFSAGLSAVNTMILYVFLAPLDWVDVRYVGVLGGAFVAQGLVVAAIAAATSRAERDGAWTVLLFGVTYAIPFTGVVVAFGYGSTGLIMIAPLGVVTAQIFLGGIVGRLSALLTLAFLLAGMFVIANGWVDYAPALDEIDRERLSDWHRVVAFGLVEIALSVAFFTLVGVVASAARLATARLAETQERLTEASRLIARYVPAELAEDILEGRAAGTEGYERRKITVFFSDLVGFTDVAEELEPEDLALVLNDYFTEMTAVARRHHGTVDELQGDALLILFGAPHATTDKEHALNAVLMAQEMQALIVDLNERWREAGITETLAIRMGINTGVVTVGNFGSADRMKYAALGKHVNVAARLQTVCEPGHVLLSYSTYLLVKERVDCEALGPQQLKGINKAVETFALR